MTPSKIGLRRAVRAYVVWYHQRGKNRGRLFKGVEGVDVAFVDCAAGRERRGGLVFSGCLRE